jgi:hypothetical protein
VDISTLRNLFQNQQLPANQATQGSLGLMGTVSMIAKMAFAAPSSSSGLVQKSMADALGKAGSPLPGNLQGLKLAMCPAMQGGAPKASPNGPAELAALHQQAAG